MAYTGQAWIDGVTPLDNVHMAALDAGVVGAVDVDNVAAAASAIVSNKLTGADTQPAFKLLGNGRMDWGAGGSTAPDTALYRSAAGVLNADIALSVYGGVTVDRSNTASRLFFGSAGDASLYRPAANELQTGGRFWANNLITGANSAAPTTAAQGIYFGSNGDTNLYRLSANELKTDGSFTAGYVKASGNVMMGDLGGGMSGGVLFGGDTSLFRATDGHLASAAPLKVNHAWGIHLNSDYGQGLGIRFGTALDTVLYRQAAGHLRTAGTMTIDGNLYLGSAMDSYLYRRAGNYLGTVGSLFTDGAPSGWGFLAYANGEANPRSMLRNDGQLLFGPGGASGMDTNLYRAFASQLRTDGIFTANHLKTEFHVYVDILDSGGKILFGSVSDTYLWRSGAATLETNGYFNILTAGTIDHYSRLGLNFLNVGARVVAVGSPDSGGSGFRALRVTN